MIYSTFEFIADDDNPESIQIYDPPDQRGMMNYIGRIDLFSGTLYIDPSVAADQTVIQIPTGDIGIAEGERWITEKLNQILV